MKQENLRGKFSNINWNHILMLCVFVFILFFLKQCNDATPLKNQLDIQALNLQALNDSVRITKNKLGEEIFVKRSLLATNKNLEDLNKDLALEVKKIQGKVITLQKIITELESDTVYITNTVTEYPGGKYSLDWNYDTTFSPGNYRTFSGNSFFVFDTIGKKVIPGITRINQDKFGFSLVTGIREKDGALEIYVDPKYPGMQITDMEGAVIDPHKSPVLKKMFPPKNWSVGPQIGLGLGGGVNFTGQPIFGPVIMVGFGIQYSIIKF
jgi:hypothetical protein